MSTHTLLRYWMVPLTGLVLLIVGASMLVRQEFQMDMRNATDNTNQNLQLLATLVHLNLQENKYQYLEETLTRFGAADPSITELKVISTENGFVIARYQRDTPATHPQDLEQTINYSYRGKATLMLQRDLAEIYQQRGILIFQLSSGIVLILALMAFLLFIVILRQREAQLMKKNAQELDSANRALTEENNQRRLAETALFNAKEHAEVTLHSIGDAVITTDTEGRVMQLNPVAATLTGWTQGDAEGQPLSSVFHIINSQTRQPAANPVDRVLATGQIVGLANHTSLIARTGHEYHIADSAAPIRDKQGRITGVVLVFHDVSEEYRQQAELSAREIELRKITRILPGPITRVDANGRYVFVSDVYADWFGQRPDDVLGLTQLEAIGPTLYAQYEPYFKKALQGEASRFEVTLPDHNQEVRHALVSVIPNFTQDNKVDGYYTFGIDITALKQAQEEALALREQLVQSTKMEAVGHLTAGIAHDFNNMLGAIIGYTELTQHVLNSGAAQHSAESYLASILKVSNRAKELIAQMLTFSRRTRRAQEESPVIQLSPVIKEVVSLLRSSIPSTIALNYQIADNDLRAGIQAVHLHQIIVNLGINARDAVGEYGKINIQLGRYHSSGSVCASCKHSFSGDYVQITVQDSGRGFSDTIRDKVFDPFFTTKSTGKGTGMGLSVVHGLVHSVGGHIRIESDNAGSRVHILLPLAASVETIEETRPADPLKQITDLKNIHILIVDDEPDMANMLCDTLQLQGARVSMFLNPLEALKSLEKDAQRVDLVITDETMPDMSGMHLARQIHVKRPSLPIILYTGYSEHATPEAAAANGLAAFFYKPVKMPELLQKIQQLVKTEK